METNLPMVAKKFWSMVRLALFMLRKGISKSKILADLNMTMKRGKIAGKAIHNLMFHHGRHWGSAATSAILRPRSSSHDNNDNFSSFTTKPHLHEYEFSCSNSPAYPGFQFHLPFHLNKRKGKHGGGHHLPPPMEDEFMSENAVVTAIEMLHSDAAAVAASPALPGFVRSPMVRQLRITDSPFPLRDEEDSRHVDEAAEKFIVKFYKDLRRQSEN